jgi:hypothetical protein
MYRNQKIKFFSTRNNMYLTKHTNYLKIRQMLLKYRENMAVCVYKTYYIYHIFFFTHLFKCAYIVWAISPPCPCPFPLPPHFFFFWQYWDLNSGPQSQSLWRKLCFILSSSGDAHISKFIPTALGGDINVLPQKEKQSVCCFLLVGLQ